MKDYNGIKQLALSCGFNHVGDLDVNTIVLREEVRDACTENKCRSYGKNWSCPPGCGTLKECEEKVRKYKSGLILQLTGELADAFDAEAMMDLAQAFADTFNKFSTELKKNYPNAMIIGAGACTRCEKCTYPDKACRFPEKMTSSMEALGMIVSDVCKANGIPYYYGQGTLTYVGCVLID